jgi:hypothetical protein
MSLDTLANPTARPKVPDVIDGSSLIRKDLRLASEKQAEPQLTILRIKRKRNEEPLEALCKSPFLDRTSSSIYSMHLGAYYMQRILIPIIVVQQEAERQNSRGQRKMRKNTESKGDG